MQPLDCQRKIKRTIGGSTSWFPWYGRYARWYARNGSNGSNDGTGYAKSTNETNGRKYDAKSTIPKYDAKHDGM